MTFTTMKFRVNDAAHSRAIQAALFGAGYIWSGDSKPFYYTPREDTFTRYIYAAADGRLTFDALGEYFDEKDYPEYLLYRGELVEAGNGTTPTVEEVQKPLVMTFDLETWPVDFSGIESRILSFNECSLQPQHFVDVPEVENVGKRQHVLRSWSMFFQGIIDGDRTSDIRWTGDRHFIIGDYLLLQEYDSAEQRYTGREQRVQITYIQQNKSNPCAISHLALADDYAVLSIKLC